MAQRLDIGPGWVALMCLLYYVNPAGVFWSFFLAAACHEFGHAAALTLLGVRIDGLRLRLDGAVLRTGPMDYRRELICALAGPAANLAAWAVRRQLPMFAVISLCLAVFNLLPVWPLDGGRVLRAALLLHFRESFARNAAAVVGVVTCALLMGAAFWMSAGLHGGLWPILAAAILLLRSCMASLDECKNRL